MNHGAVFQEHSLLPATIEGAIWPYSPAYAKPCHFHGQVEFLVVRKGRARARIGREFHAVHAGQLVWHLPGVEHELVDASSDLDLRVVHAEPDLCADVWRTLANRSAPAAPSGDWGSFSGWTRDLGWLASGRPVVELSGGDRDALLEDCDRTCADDLRPDDARVRLRRALAKAWTATRRDHDDTRASSLVELACWLLLETPAQDRSSICRALDVSDSYLSRRFQAELGISFAEQRSRLRIARFVTHVERESKNYLEAGLLAGFGSYSQLHRTFVHVIGASPRRYFSEGLRNQRANQLSY